MDATNTVQPARRPLVRGYFYNNPDHYPPIVNAIRLLCRSGFDIELYCRDNGERLGNIYPPEAKIIWIDNRGRGSWMQFLAFIWQAVSKSRSDVGLFWGHDMHGFVAERLAAWRCRRPLVYHCHDYADPGWMTAGIHVVHAFERRYARTSDATVIPDGRRGEMMKRVLKLPSEPIVAANAPLMTPLSTRGALREALLVRGIKFEKIVFRQGRIGRGHGIEVTLRSMPWWQSKNWGFVVMGIGETEYSAHLAQLAQQLGLGDRFVILPPVKYDEILHFTPGADLGHALYERIHVNNTHIGTASNKVMEYLAAGIPLLVSPNETLKDLIQRWQCGACADETDPGSIAEAVNAILTSSKVDKIKMAARTAFEAEFCYDRQFQPVIARMRALAVNSSGSR